MSTPIDDGDPADSMSVRDYAVIHFTAAILANPASYDKDGIWRDEHHSALETATEIADDFIAARKETK